MPLPNSGYRSPSYTSCCLSEDSSKVFGFTLSTGQDCFCHIASPTTWKSSLVCQPQRMRQRDAVVLGKWENQASRGEVYMPTALNMASRPRTKVLISECWGKSILAGRWNATSLWKTGTHKSLLSLLKHLLDPFQRFLSFNGIMPPRSSKI